MAGFQCGLTHLAFIFGLILLLDLEEPCAAFTFRCGPGYHTGRYHHRGHLLTSYASSDSVSTATRGYTNYSVLDDANNAAELSTHTYYLSKNLTWSKTIAALRAYKDRHGTANIPERGENSHKVLGRFLENARRQRATLLPQQVRDLDNLGISWKGEGKRKFEEQWQTMYMRLKEYKKEHGNCVVPTDWIADPSLGGWVKSQRRKYLKKTIEADRLRLLEDIGFVWQIRKLKQPSSKKRAEQWQRMYQELVEFHREHGHYNVPKKHGSLGHWVRTQRGTYWAGTMLKERQEALEAIDFNFHDAKPSYDKAWMDKYDELKVYYQEWELFNSNNSTHVKATDVRPFLLERTRLWMWEQRRSRSKESLDPKRESLLDEIGFHWDGPTKRPAKKVKQEDNHT